MKSKDQKRMEALTRNSRWASLTPQQQLSHLDQHGLAAKRQRKKLEVLLARQQG